MGLFGLGKKKKGNPNIGELSAKGNEARWSKNQESNVLKPLTTVLEMEKIKNEIIKQHIENENNMMERLLDRMGDDEAPEQDQAESFIMDLLKSKMVSPSGNGSELPVSPSPNEAVSSIPTPQKDDTVKLLINGIKSGLLDKKTFLDRAISLEIDETLAEEIYETIKKNKSR